MRSRGDAKENDDQNCVAEDAPGHTTRLSPPEHVYPPTNPNGRPLAGQSERLVWLTLSIVDQAPVRNNLPTG